jgi:hypothetical protein
MKDPAIIDALGVLLWGDTAEDPLDSQGLMSTVASPPRKVLEPHLLREAVKSLIPRHTARNQQG